MDLHVKPAPCSKCGGLFKFPKKFLRILKCPYCGNEKEIFESKKTIQEIKKFFNEFKLDEKTLLLKFRMFSDLKNNSSAYASTLISGFLAFPMLVVIIMLAVKSFLFQPEELLHYDVITIIIFVIVFNFIFYLNIRNIFYRPFIRFDNNIFEFKSGYNSLQVETSQIIMFTCIPVNSLNHEILASLFGYRKTFHEKNGYYYALMLHKKDGSAVLLSPGLSRQESEATANSLNLFLSNAAPPDIELQIKEKIPAISNSKIAFSSKPAPGRCLEIKIPQLSPPKSISCSSCGASVSVPLLKHIGDTISCGYCSDLLVIKFLNDEETLSKITINNDLVTKEGNNIFYLNKNRTAYNYSSSKNEAINYLIAFWIFHGMMFFLGILAQFYMEKNSIKEPAILFILNSIPVLYFMRSFQVRGKRNDILLKLLRFSFAGAFMSLGYLPILLYRSFGFLNKYKLIISDEIFMERYRFSSPIIIPSDDIEESFLYRWDKFSIVWDAAEDLADIEEKIKIFNSKSSDEFTFTDPRYIYDKAIWGVALVLKNGSVYHSIVLTDKPTADLIVLQINSRTKYRR